MAAYTYKGKIHDAVPEPVRAPEPPKPPEPTEPPVDYCGTYAGYKRHQRRNEPVCDRCRVANAAYRLARYHATKKPATPRPAGVFNPSACGTHNGYERHRRNLSTPCGPCRAAHTEYHRAYRAERSAA